MNASPIRCLLSAGPTREYFDPVRFLSNPSTGKMGYALAEAAAARGWAVTLVSGPVALADPAGVAVIRVETGEEMFEALQARFAECDLLVMTAAVMDYRPRQRSAHKVKKHQLGLTLEMEPTRDILRTLGARKTSQLVVGFAAETERVEEYARDKLRAKNCDYIVANRVGAPGVGFASDDNQVILLAADGSSLPLGPAPKRVLAEQLVECWARCRGPQGWIRPA